MIAVLIEAEPRNGQWDAYLAEADSLQSRLEQSPGFVGDLRYRSLLRNGWILSLSEWSDEDSVAGWHARTSDDDARWLEIVADYRLRIGQIVSDTQMPERGEAAERRDGPGAAQGTYVTLINARQTPQWVAASNPQEMALYLGFDLYSSGDCISWDIFDSLSTPGEIILAVTWKDAQSARDHAATELVPDDARVRVVRVVRDDAIHDAPFEDRPAVEPRQSISG